MFPWLTFHPVLWTVLLPSSVRMGGGRVPRPHPGVRASLAGDVSLPDHVDLGRDSSPRGVSTR